MTELAPQDKEILDQILKRVRAFEDTLGSHYRDGLWRRMDELYHGYTGLKRALRDAKGRERDGVYQDARKEFGHQLFIPFAYAIVETVLPVIVSNQPRVLILPADQASERNVLHVKALIDTQQSQINVEIPMQSVIKSGLQYGLGIGKSYWLRREAMKARVVPLSPYHPARLTGKKWAIQRQVEPLFDDPTFEHVPVRDFFWDVFAASIEMARWAAHRTWRDTEYVKSRLDDPNGWTRTPLQPADIEGNNGSMERYRRSVQASFEAQYMPVPSLTGERAQSMHEVIEYHDRGQIVTVLDRQWVVSVVPNEVWAGKLPFHCYRPTEVLNQFVGKGEIEPIEDLQEEMNQIRTDRRWNSAMAMAPFLFYNEGIVDPDKIVMGPGEMNAVNGDPNELIKIIQIPDVPNSSWRETAEIAADIVRTSGYSDTFGGGDTANTATEAQLQYQGMSSRIRLKAHRAEIEIMKPLGTHWVALDQRHILDTKDVRVPSPPVPGEPERRWSWFQLTPAELAGEFDIEIDGGSSSPENTPQERQDAQILATAAAGPLGQMLDPRQLTIRFLEKMGEKNPEAMLASGQMIPAAVLDAVVQNLTREGVDPQVAQQLVMGSLQEVQGQQDAQAAQPDHGQPQQPGQPPPQ